MVPSKQYLILAIALVSLVMNPPPLWAMETKETMTRSHGSSSLSSLMSLLHVEDDNNNNRVNNKSSPVPIKNAGEPLSQEESEETLSSPPEDLAVSFMPAMQFQTYYAKALHLLKGQENGEKIDLRGNNISSKDLKWVFWCLKG